MSTHWLHLMYREALERLDDAEALRSIRPDSNSSYLLELIGFELLLKFTAYTSEPRNIECKRSFRHNYKKIFDALPQSTQSRLLTLAGDRIGPSGLSSGRDAIFADWTANFDGLRYPFEKYEGDTAEEYQARGDEWLKKGAPLDAATFRFHHLELVGLLHALRIEAHEQLRQLPE
ncbi:hypothetical protein E2P84_44115 [Burkholderia cepacia]|uniref:HEPN AbiU2-like domain-containing protein n=1 Tax=Burkholderia cepacia TaxID=292 RepID=A0AAX2RR19_BURCE|nr:hypothetical protein [Burkholderia cepacia]TES60688.1 hypothetical protein E2P84_44115 [Burkholderia cepacia]TET01637.1 hypothetical protein E3D36_16515 [Burkholderia cepacia]TEU47495.1 hypothetical protein E3D37_15945 [Burkholderia cepacia]TEU53522.1 hypothetical protein E3D38_12335 [Burkholderia cepacia]TEV02128.1 hypothetical protein E3D40_13265 [Burkholderia cepacia]